ncbi:hypothetical protein [Streptomyces sp. NPDC127039]|uniref:hypothetical protein n=1 Tax=Streptomyces sp. NPDC127039 TaxID=3347115 RepID=UPI00365ADFDA
MATNEYQDRKNALAAKAQAQTRADVAFHEGERATAEAEKTTAFNQMMGQINDPGTRFPGEPR